MDQDNPWKKMATINKVKGNDSGTNLNQKNTKESNIMKKNEKKGSNEKSSPPPWMKKKQQNSWIKKKQPSKSPQKQEISNNPWKKQSINFDKKNVKQQKKNIEANQIKKQENNQLKQKLQKDKIERIQEQQKEKQKFLQQYENQKQIKVKKQEQQKQQKQKQERQKLERQILERQILEKQKQKRQNQELQKLEKEKQQRQNQERKQAEKQKYSFKQNTVKQIVFEEQKNIQTTMKYNKQQFQNIINTQYQDRKQSQQEKKQQILDVQESKDNIKDYQNSCGKENDSNEKQNKFEPTVQYCMKLNFTLDQSQIKSSNISQKSINIFYRYLQLFNLTVSKSDYLTRMQYQKQLINLQRNFGFQVQKQLKQLMKKKKLNNRKNKIIELKDMQIVYSMCQGIKTQSKIKFNMEQVYQLQDKYKIYDKLYSIVNKLCKKMGIFPLRVPLIGLFQYKGITFLCECSCLELMNMKIRDSLDFIEINCYLLQLEHELKDNNMTLKLTDLMVKKIQIDHKQYYFLYLKNIHMDHNRMKPEQLIKLNMNEQGKFKNIRIFQADLQFYERTVTSSIYNIIQCIYQAQIIYIVYCSCQGEIEQNSFLKLLLQENQELWSMIRNAGYNGPLIRKGLLIQALEDFASMKLEISSQIFNKNNKYNKPLNKFVLVHKQTYGHEGFELIDFCGNLEKHLKQNNISLAKQILKLKKSLITQEKYNQINLNILKEEINLMICEKIFQQVIQNLKLACSRVSLWSSQSISIRLILLAVYVIQDDQIELLKILADLLGILEWFYGGQSIVHIQVYCMMGSYYSSKGEAHLENTIKFYEHALNITIKFYGNQHYQVPKIYLKRASAFYNLNQHQLLIKDAGQTIKLFHNSSKFQTKIAQAYALIGKSQIKQDNWKNSIKHLQWAIQIYIKVAHAQQAIELLQLIMSITKNQSTKDKIQEKIILTAIEFRAMKSLKSNLRAIFKKQLILIPTITEQQVWQKFKIQESNGKKCLLKLEEYIHSFNSIIEMIKWSLYAFYIKKQSHEQIQSEKIIRVIIGII